MELKPTILCIEAASSQSGVFECLGREGVASDYRYPEEPRTAEDFKRQALVMWAGFWRGGATRLSPQNFDLAMKYVACIEDATNALQRLEGEPKEAIGTGQRKAQLKCADQFLSTQSLAKRHPSLLTRNPDTPEGEAKAYMLARIFSAAAYRYVIEANGWVTDQMRPCVRHLDGRAPSPSCTEEPGYVAPPPPAPRPGAINSK